MQRSQITTRTGVELTFISAKVIYIALYRKFNYFYVSSIVFSALICGFRKGKKESPVFPDRHKVSNDTILVFKSENFIFGT